tara:strand:+ start:536 stop:1465 length:930 start_codon:yes stop_codon:yes gene_type:complete
MEEGTTSPAAEAAPATSEVSTSTAETSVESPESNPASPDNHTALGGSSAEERLSATTPDPLSGFDASVWDGNMDVLPEILREPVGFLHKQLESGYTKKFQDLAEQRKAFDTERADLEALKKTQIEIQEERDLLRSILGGAEDPRLGQYTAENERLKNEMGSLQSEFDQFKEYVEAEVDAQAAEYAEQYKKKHAHIFKSENKREQLGGLLDAGWDPDAAARLVGQNEKTIEIANALRSKGTPSEVAVEHALMKAGKRKRAPRPAAQLTSGAENRNNPASVRGAQAPRNPREARLSAAREAVNWSAKNRLT